MTRHTAILALTALANPTLADGTATWLWEVSTQNGDAIVEPGETATVTISLLMQTADAPFIALNTAVFDTLGDFDAQQGRILGWFLHQPFIDYTGDLTTTDGVNLYNTTAVQLTIGPFSSDNPIDVLTFEWAPTSYQLFEAGYVTQSTYPSLHEVVVWVGEDKVSADSATYPVIEAAIVIGVVPSPATALLLAMLASIRRRR
jgi:hypothetical protein